MLGTAVVQISSVNLRLHLRLFLILRSRPRETTNRNVTEKNFQKGVQEQKILSECVSVKAGFASSWMAIPFGCRHRCD